MYKQKYKKYKKIYNRSKTLGPGQRPFDLYLFFDLLQVSEEILNITTKNDVLILIGESPAYLKPFLENERKIFNLPFSARPFSCVKPLTGETVDRSSSLDPTLDETKSYFKNLENTFLTRKFVKDNWVNIVLIDYSKGQSITGASIFFNRYVGNIPLHAPCHHISGAQPIQFINISSKEYIFTNIDPFLANILLKNKGKAIYNFNPDLIILLATVEFYSVGEFLFSQYPRFVPSYYPFEWNENPFSEEMKQRYAEGYKTLEILEKLLRLFWLFAKDTLSGDQLMELLDILNSLPKLRKKEQTLLGSISTDESDEEIKEKLTRLFKIINMRLLLAKCS